MGSATDSSLDAILVQVGDFGKYQAFMFGLVCLAVILHSGVHVAFVFTAMDLEYRCDIPECDPSVSPQFEPPWLKNAVPYEDGKPPKCSRYLPKPIPYNDTITCEKSDFLLSKKQCDSFIYKTEEISILREYDLQCDENLWKLTLVGTVNNVGQFFGLFIAGIISDKYGRRITMVLGLVFCGICGLAQTLAPSYLWYLALEFLNATFGAGTYACGFIMGVELVGPKKRVLVGTIVSSCYAVGEIMAAGSAWIFQTWRAVIYILYGPPILLTIYLWILPESIRWNLSKGHIEEAKETLRKVARVNGTTVSENSLEKLGAAAEPAETKEKHSIMEVIRSTPLLLRFINCCFCWITCAFLFYGLTLNSVALAGNGYLDFILTALVEIPAYVACVYFVDRIGRKWSLSISFFITGISCLVFIFLPTDAPNASLAFYLLGKFGATAAFTVAYIITTELFPTPLRHTLMGACSTFGRIGSMISPQTPLLAQIWGPLPLIMFTGMSLVAGFLSLLFPETVNVKLPDTIEEAINIGKSNKNKHDIPKMS